MMSWLDNMEGSKRQNLLRTARKGGKVLQDLHVQSEKKVMAEIHEDMKENKKRKNSGDQDGQPRRRRFNEEETNDSGNEAALLETLPDGSRIAVNEYVAVAYEDKWYPGIVTERKDNEQVVVKFLDSTKSAGVYQWPQRDDIQVVHTNYILKSSFIPECLHSGRMWRISEFQGIDQLYREYRNEIELGNKPLKGPLPRTSSLPSYVEMNDQKVKSPNSSSVQHQGHPQQRSLNNQQRGQTPPVYRTQEEQQFQPQYYPGTFYNQQFPVPPPNQHSQQQQVYTHDLNKQSLQSVRVQGTGGLVQQPNLYQNTTNMRPQNPQYYRPTPQTNIRPNQQYTQMPQQPQGGQGQFQAPGMTYIMQPSQPTLGYGSGQIIVQPQLLQGARMNAQQYTGMPPSNTTGIPPYTTMGQGTPQYSGYNTIMYAGPQTNRPPSGSSMQQPYPTQQQQAPQQKREKKRLQIVDPNTGKDISEEILHTNAAGGGQNAPGSSRSTPPSGPGSGSRSTPVGATQSQSDIPAQFAAKVAATLKEQPRQSPPHHMDSLQGNVVPNQTIQTDTLSDAPKMEQPVENSIHQYPQVDAIPSSNEGERTVDVKQSNEVLEAEPSADVQQPSLEPSQEQLSAASVTDSISSTTSLSSSQDVVLETVAAADHSRSESDSISEKTDSGIEKDSESPAPSSEASVNITSAEPPSLSQPEVNPTVETETKPFSPASGVSVVKTVLDSRTSTDMSNQGETEETVTLQSPESASNQEPVSEEGETIKPISNAAASGEPTAEAAAKDLKKSKKKAKDLNKKGEGLSTGSDMDAFIDNKPSETQTDSVAPPVEEKTDAEVVKAEPVSMVEIRIENQSVQEENEKNQEKTKEAEKMNSVDEKQSQELKYKYKEDQWSPLNPEGKRLYDRDFLLQLQYSSDSTTKPAGLPDLPEIILEKPHSANMGGGSRLSYGSIPDFSGRGSFDFTPGFVKGQRSGNSPMPKRGSATGRKGGNPPRIISIGSQEVSLHKAESAWKPNRKQEQVKDEDEKKIDELYKKVRSILNKLTPQKFQTLVKQMSDLEINTEDKLKGVTDLVFEKAISEPGFSVAYASMCRYLTMVKVPSQTKSGDVNFRAILLTRCQREFEKDKDSEVELEKRRKEINETADSEKEKKDALKEELQMEETKARRRSLGNIRFIGELFKLKMLTENIMHDCLFKLLRAKDEESLECLCRLLFTIGKELDTDKAKPRMDQYFHQMEKIVSEKKTSSRVRFMLQDVLELRQNRWVPRRDENNPKTLDQIHKEALKEEQERQVFLQQANAQQKAQRGGSGGGPRGSRGPPTAGPMGSNDGWNTVGKPNIRVERQSIDPSRLKFSKQNLDESNIQLGPGGGANRFAGWQRGSTGGGARNSQEAEKSSTPSNRFSALSKTDDESRSKFGVSPARGESRGRGFGRPPGRGVTPRSSQEQERERAIAAVKDVVGQTPSKGASRESSRGREQRRVEVEKVEKPATPPVKQLTEAEMDKKTKTILDEYLHIQDIKEAILCVEELNSPSTMHVFVSAAVNHVIERSEKARNQTGLLLHDLVKKTILSVDSYIKGLTEILQYAEDMEIDIPKIWQYFGELIGPMVQDGSVPLQFLRQAAEPLKPNKKAGKLVAEVLHAASHREGHKKVGSLWRQSSLKWDEFMPKDEVSEFVKDKKVEFTEGDGSQPSTPTVSRPIESIQEKLNELLMKQNTDNEEIFDWIEENVDDPTIKSKKFVRALMTSVCQSAITGSGNSARVVEDTVKMRGVLLQKYLDHQAEFELQALYAVQALVHKLEHPPGVLRTLFDTLYDEDIISEDAFNQWEKSTDAAEQEGKGVAMKQVVQFFTWLRETEDFSDS